MYVKKFEILTVKPWSFVRNNFNISNVLVHRYPNIRDANEKHIPTFETFSPLTKSPSY